MKRKSIFLILLITFVVSMGIVAAINVNIALPVKNVDSNLTLKNIEAYTVEGESAGISLYKCYDNVTPPSSHHHQGLWSSWNKCDWRTSSSTFYVCSSVIGDPFFNV